MVIPLALLIFTSQLVKLLFLKWPLCPPSSRLSHSISFLLSATTECILSDVSLSLCFLHSHLHVCRVVLRYDQRRGDVLDTARLPDATARQLSRRAVRDHDVLLEEQTWGQAHLWVHAERPGWLLHRHRGTVPATTIDRDTWSEYRHFTVTPYYTWSHLDMCFYFCNCMYIWHISYTFIFASDSIEYADSKMYNNVATESACTNTVGTAV